MQHFKPVDDQTDLCQDTEDRTWFFQRYLGDNRTVESQTFATEELAREAWAEGTIQWEH